MAESGQIRAMVAFLSEDDETTFQIQRTDGGPYSARYITLPDGLYYPSGDGTASDLLQAIIDQIEAHAEFVGEIQITVDTDTGLIGIGMATGTATITWGAGGTRLRDWWALAVWGEASMTIGAVAKAGSRAVTATMHPTLILIEDLLSIEPEVDTLLSSEGAMETIVHESPKTIARARLILKGGHRRASARGERNDAISFFDYASAGLPLRIYYDRDVSAAYVEFSEPDGYETYWLHEDDRMWADELAFGDWYEYYERGFKLRLYVAP